MAVADWSGQAWLQGFNEAAVIVFGMSGNELYDLKVGVISYRTVLVELIVMNRCGMKTNITPSFTRPIVKHIISRVAPRRIHMKCAKIYLLLKREF